MNRRAFVTGSLVPALAPLGPEPFPSGGTGREETTAGRGPQLLELRSYHLRFGPMEARFAEYAKGALFPALNRAGVKPVGAFTVLLGPDTPTVTLLLPYPSAELLLTLDAALEADTDYRRAAGAFLGLPASDPPYAKRDSTLLATFEALPRIEVPAGPLASPSRVFELRAYDSHSETAGRKKIEMFEKAGEIAIFRRVGLTPVFFGRNLVGPRLPGLTYMLVFPDAVGREKSWGVFRDDPEWVKLRATAGFTNPEILTNVHNVLLRPTEYSQV